MKRTIVLLVLVATVAFFIFMQRQELPRLLPSTEEVDIEAYEGTPPLLNIAFEYPKSWKIFVSRAKRVEEATVQVLGPRDPGHQFSVSFSVIGKKIQEAVSLEKEEKALIERNKTLNQFRLVSKGIAKVDGEPSRRVTFDFSMNLPVRVQAAPSVVIREEVILLARADALYQIHFIGTAEQHQRNKALFQKTLKSFRFKD